LYFLAIALILSGMLFALKRYTANEFSFFLAIPIIFAATGYDLLKKSGNYYP
jgi:undecaprenyl-diphosphatase